MVGRNHAFDEMKSFADKINATCLAIADLYLDNARISALRTDRSCAALSTSGESSSIRSGVRRAVGPAILTAPMTRWSFEWRTGAAIADTPTSKASCAVA